MIDALVVGYGSDLRGDDAAGRRVAERIASLALPGVRARSLHQLAPELAAELAGCRLVVFVDADPGAGEVTVGALEPAESETSTTHHAAPEGLLSLAGRLFGHSPRAVLVRVPATDFEIGAGFSPMTQKGIDQAVAAVTALVSSTTASG